MELNPLAEVTQSASQLELAFQARLVQVVDRNGKVEKDRLLHGNLHETSPFHQDKKANKVDNYGNRGHPSRQKDCNQGYQQGHEEDANDDVAENQLGLLHLSRSRLHNSLVEQGDEADHFISRNLVKDKEVSLLEFPMS